MTLFTHTRAYISEIPIVWSAYFAISRWNVWDGLMLRVGIIIFHLFFILILLRRAERRDRGKLVRSLFPWCLGMFLRGVLEVGHGGPEERANKQVAEGGTRWDANSVLRQATLIGPRRAPCGRFRRGALHKFIPARVSGENYQIEIEKGGQDSLIFQTISSFDVAFFTGSRREKKKRRKKKKLSSMGAQRTTIWLFANSQNANKFKKT